MTLLAVTGIGFGGLVVATGQGHEGAGGSRHGEWHGRADHGMPLDHMTETLNLTPDQQAKVKPILDQARPQMIAIHQEAMQKAKAVMDDTMAKIRPMLTPEQQKKADDIKTAHEQMHDAAKKLHDAQGQ
jgi:Spy/CpxP family protein refolding chaperone